MIEVQNQTSVWLFIVEDEKERTWIRQNAFVKAPARLDWTSDKTFTLDAAPASELVLWLRAEGMCVQPQHQLVTLLDMDDEKSHPQGNEGYGSKVDEVIYHCEATKGYTREDWIALALAALDQAGIKPHTCEAVKELVDPDA